VLESLPASAIQVLQISLHFADVFCKTMPPSAARSHLPPGIPLPDVRLDQWMDIEDGSTRPDRVRQVASVSSRKPEALSGAVSTIQK
jgi:hypothetical protein